MSLQDRTGECSERARHETQEEGAQGARVRLSDAARARLDAGDLVEVLVEADDVHAVARAVVSSEAVAADEVRILAEAFPAPLLVARLSRQGIEAVRAMPGVRSIEENAEVRAEPPAQRMSQDG